MMKPTALPSKSATNASDADQVSHVDGTEARTPVLPLVLMPVGILLQAVDVILAKGVFDVLVNTTEEVSWIVAFGVAGTAGLASLTMGLALKARSYVWAGFFGLFWLGLGGAMAGIRAWAAVLAEGADGPQPVDVALAALLIGLYLIAGLDLAWCAHKAYSPARTRLRRNACARWLLERVLVRVEAQYARVCAWLGQRDDRSAELDARLAHTLAEIDHREALNKAYARDRIALALADPARTGVIRQPHEPGAETA